MNDKGHGHLFKRGLKYYLQIRVNGRKKVVALKTGRLDEAEKKAEDYRRIAACRTKEEFAFHVSKARKLSKDSALALDKVWAHYAASPERPDSSPGTLKNYKRNWESFLKWLGDNHPATTRLSQVDESLAKEYAAWLWERSIGERKNASGEAEKVRMGANTYNYHIQSLALVARIVGPDVGVEENPWKCIKKKTEAKQVRKDFSKAQVEALLAAFDDDRLKLLNKDELRLLFHIGAFTGLRLEGAVNLKWDKVDFAKGIISAIPAKTRRIQREVVIPIHSRLKAELVRARDASSGFVLPGIVERYARNPYGVNEDILKVLDFCELKQKNEGVERGRIRRLYGFHSFRHFFASTCANAGVPVTTLSEILGDNISTLQKYYMHSMDESRQKVLKALPSAEVNERDELIAQIETHIKTMDLDHLRVLASSCLG
jgi:integrase